MTAFVPWAQPRPGSQAPGSAPWRKGSRARPRRLPPLGEALTLWGFPASSINNPPPLPTNSSPFLEKRDSGQGLRAAVCQAEAGGPRRASCPEVRPRPAPGATAPGSRGTLPLFEAGSGSVTQPGSGRASAAETAVLIDEDAAWGPRGYAGDARPLLAGRRSTRRPSLTGATSRPRQAQRGRLQGPSVPRASSWQPGLSAVPAPCRE